MTYREYEEFPWEWYQTRSDGAPVLMSSGIDKTTKVFSDYPATVSRPRPVDLFAGGTARTVTTRFIDSGSLNYATHNGSNIYEGRATQLLYPLTSSVRSRNPALDPVDWVLMENQIRDNVRGEAVNLAMAMAEYRKTAEMFAAAAKVVATRGRSVVDAIKKDKGVSKAFLGFQYGVRPLASDIVGSIDAVRKRALEPIYLHGVESRKVSKVTQLNKAVSWNATNFLNPADVEFHRVRRARVQYRVKVSANSVSNTLTRHGFANPFALAYELIPFSFVLDWWINVGDVLSSLDNLLLCDSIQVIRSTSVTTGAYITVPAYRRGKEYMTASHWKEIERVDTRARPSFISPISVLRYKPSVSYEHIANGSALLNVLRGRLR